MLQFLTENWQAILAGLTGAAGFFMGRKERKAKVIQEQGTAVETAQRIYDTLLEDVKEQYQGLKEKVNTLEQREREGMKERAMMEGQLKEMGKQISMYERKVAELKKENAQLEQQIESLKAELTKYQIRTV